GRCPGLVCDALSGQKCPTFWECAQPTLIRNNPIHLVESNVFDRGVPRLVDVFFDSVVFATQ
ncbi:hypothetical protein MHK_008562, partial [Candidatus Magnetomorum sp. HK-1]